MHMTGRRKIKAVLTALGVGMALMALGATTSDAQTVTVTGLTQMPRTTSAGQEAFFYGTLTNTDPINPVALGTLSVDFSGQNGGDGSYLTQDLYDEYTNNILDTLTLSPANQAGASYTGELFGIITYTGQADPNTDTPSGNYSEAFTLSDTSGDALDVSDFTLAVATAAPEPSPLIVLGLAGISLATMAYARGHRRATGAASPRL